MYDTIIKLGGGGMSKGQRRQLWLWDDMIYKAIKECNITVLCVSYCHGLDTITADPMHSIVRAYVNIFLEKTATTPLLEPKWKCYVLH